MPRGVFKFDEFALDCDRFELLRAGHPIKLEKLPMELLILLVEKGGHLVTRQEIVERLWGPGVFLDTEHGINTAIRKIRNVLRDNPEQSRFVQTVTGKGYRFIAVTSAVSSGQGNGNHGEAGFASAETAQAETELSDRDRQSADRATLLAPTTQPARSFPKVLRTASLALLAAIATSAVVVGLNVGSVRSRLTAHAPQPRIRSLAVLPLVNLSGDPAQNYFAEGLTDELITMLARNTSLRVISRTSAMRYKGVSRPLHDIARELGTDGILEGSISRSATRIHLTVQLVEGQNDTHIWAESYDRDLSDTLSLLSELSRTIAKEVKVATSLQTLPQNKINPEAHGAYLRGRALWFYGDYGRAQDYFQKAIQLQPDYAAAWSGLADTYAGQAVEGTSPTRDLRERADTAARRALELDDSLGEAHHTMAAVHYFLEWNWKAAEAESLRAIQLSPNFSEAHHLRCYVLQTLNRPEEALQEQKLASELDPSLRPWALGREFLHVRRYDAAVKELRARAEEHPHALGLRSILADAYHFAGMAKQSVHEYEEIYRSDNDTEAAEAVQREFQRGGEQAVAVWRLNRWKKAVGRGHADPYALAAKYARAGRRENTLRTLEDAYKERSAMLAWLQIEPDFDFLHSEPRYQAIVKKMGLPAAP